MAVGNDLLSICTYNMHGFQQGEHFLKKNINAYDVWCVQEHWLYPGNTDELNNVSDDYECIVVCDVANDDIVGPGRPKGGLAIMWKKSLMLAVTVIGNSLNNRIMTAIIECAQFSLCLCNVYLPCFEQSIDYNIELLECMSYIEHVFEQLSDDYGNMEVCIIGDFNINIQKIYNNCYVNCFKDFIRDNKLIILSEQLDADGGYTYCNESLCAFSMIDHCVVSEKVGAKMVDICIVESVDNMSDHLPLVVRFEVNVCHSVVHERDDFRTVLWDLNAVKMYYGMTRNELYKLNMPDCCGVGMCGNSCHNDLIDNYCKQIIHILSSATV
jgi:exonuclease III